MFFVRLKMIIENNYLRVNHNSLFFTFPLSSLITYYTLREWSLHEIAQPLWA